MRELFSTIKPEQWVLLSGAALFLGIALVALFPGDFEVDVETAKTGPAQNQAHLHRQVRQDGGKAPVNAPFAVTAPQMSGAQGQVVQWQQPAQMQNVMRPMQPLKVGATEHYQGQVTQVINRDPGGWGQIHVMVQSGGRQQEISLAPEWYLSFQGCSMKNGQQVSGEAFRFDRVRPTAPLYARHVTVNGMRCRLRTLEGLALWSDQPR
jgi:hypothetical protein